MHELESLGPDSMSKCTAHPIEEFVRRWFAIQKSGDRFIMIAGDVNRFHCRQAVQQRSPALDDLLQRIAQQFEKVAYDDELALLARDVVEKRIEQRFSVSVAKVVFGGSISDVEIADDEDRSVVTNRVALSNRPCSAATGASSVFRSHISEFPVNRVFATR